MRRGALPGPALPPPASFCPEACPGARAPSPLPASGVGAGRCGSAFSSAKGAAGVGAAAGVASGVAGERPARPADAAACSERRVRLVRDEGRGVSD